MKREYSYSDVDLKPNRKCIVNSRRDCDTSVKLGKNTFKMPIIAANMKSVINEETCELFAYNNWFYIMHRFDVNPLHFIDNMKEKGYLASISMGVNEESYAQLRAIKFAKLDKDLDYCTIDIAHCWSPKGERMIKYMKDNFPDTFLIAGNVGCAEAIVDLEEWGADCCKAGIAGGSVCITRIKTGFHTPMFSLGLECSQVAKKPFILDGGIREPRDIAKGLVAGATMVMAGNMFAGWKESAGGVIKIENKKYKRYFGSASESNKDKNKHIEGTEMLLEYKGEMIDFIDSLDDDLRSAISYAGGNDLSAFNNLEHILVKG